MRMMIGGLAALALAGCASQGGNEQAAAPGNGAGAGAGTSTATAQIQPGQWEMTFAIDKMEMPGMPAGANPAAQPAQKASTCITPEQAAKPAGDVFAGKAAGDCKFDSFTMNNGKMNATMSCKMPNMPGQTKTVMSGTYASTEFANEVTSTVSGMPGGQTAVIHATSSGRRVGECPAKAG